MTKKIINFFKEVKVEMVKITWPSKDELVSSTTVVILTSIFVALFIGVVDVILSRLVRLLLR